MSRFLYYLVIKPLSHLPLWVLYFLSDFIFFLMYHIVGYRKPVVYKNLKNSFPEKSPKEIRTIQKDFFIHLCDVIVENIKLFSISRQELQERYKIINKEVFEHYFKQGRSIILVGGHYNNWEMVGKGLKLYSPYRSIGIYTPLTDKFFDRKIRESRSINGMELIPKGLVVRSFIANKNELTMMIFAADQSPTYNKKVHWTTFMNQETCVYIGAEMFAMKYNYPVIFLSTHKIKRGYYEGVLKVIEENPTNTKIGEITESHTRYLEKIIMDKPQYWLWSHKRWKRKRTEAERQVELV
jgi:KDO2-lipid IV(A) lauroyltransferase